jgi:hypothetical protein
MNRDSFRPEDKRKAELLGGITAKHHLKAFRVRHHT